MKYKTRKDTKRGEVLREYKEEKIKNKVSGDKTVIVAKYLDGTKDTFPVSDDVKISLDNELEKQAQDFVEVTSSSQTKVCNNLSVAGGLAALASMGTLVMQYVNNHTLVSNEPKETALNVALAAVAAVGSALVISNFKRRKDISKYKTYMTNKDLLVNDFQDVIKTEARLKGETAVEEVITYNNLDNFSKKDIEERITKVKRYQNIKK